VNALRVLVLNPSARRHCYCYDKGTVNKAPRRKEGRRLTSQSQSQAEGRYPISDRYTDSNAKPGLEKRNEPPKRMTSGGGRTSPVQNQASMERARTLSAPTTDHSIRRLIQSVSLFIWSLPASRPVPAHPLPSLCHTTHDVHARFFSSLLTHQHKPVWVAEREDNSADEDRTMRMASELSGMAMLELDGSGPKRCEMRWRRPRRRD
jgi:hypothetical protein